MGSPVASSHPITDDANLGYDPGNSKSEVATILPAVTIEDGELEFDATNLFTLVKANNEKTLICIRADSNQ